MKYPKEIQCPICKIVRFVDYRIVWAIKKGTTTQKCFHCSRLKKGASHSGSFKKGQVSWNKGKEHSAQQKEKLKLAWVKRKQKGLGQTNLGKKFPYKPRKPRPDIQGERNHNWQGGITAINDKIRQSPQYKTWREGVYSRDNWTCTWCGKVGGKLNADHIKPFAHFHELRYDLDNGRTLCVDCHKKTDTYLVKSRWIKK